MRSGGKGIQRMQSIERKKRKKCRKHIEEKKRQKCNKANEGIMIHGGF